MMRTEEEILKEFEELGYEVDNDDVALILSLQETLGTITKYITIFISKRRKLYITRSGSIGMEEHKLLSELFTVWGWIENDR